MSKIATYLNEHLMGHVSVAGADLVRNSTDGSVLLQKPEMVARVASTSDIRKIARFCWQLAEKGHALSMTVRGEGTDATGAAIGSGIIIDPTDYMNRVIGIDPKQRLIHVQAGASYKGVNMTLSTHKGLTLPNDSYGASTGTIGGAISSGAVGFLSERYGSVGSAVEQLEVVLANGDVLQTGKISRRELNAKKGLHNMEGDVYRKLDNLITDNDELINSLQKDDTHSTAGFHNIAQVKKKDGSFDLTPLFTGAQGSLGIITEVIMRAKFAHPEFSVVIAAYSKFSDAQVAADEAIAAKAKSVELVDGRILERAAKLGKKRDFAPKESFKGGLMMAIYDDFSERVRVRAAKRLLKKLESIGDSPINVVQKSYSQADLSDIRSVLSVARANEGSSIITPGVFRGLWLPVVRLDGFLSELRKLEKAYSMKLPVHVDVTSGFIDIYAQFDMKRISDRQKLVKLLNDLAQLMSKYGGSIAGSGGDGRLKTLANQRNIDKDLAELYSSIKNIFDPYGILNAGAKHDISPKDTVTQLNSWCRSL